MESHLGFAHFLAQADLLAHAVLIALVVLSIASWYLILSKAISNLLQQRRAAAFLGRFSGVHNSVELQALVDSDGAGHAFADLAREALATARLAQTVDPHSLASAGGFAEFLTRSLRTRMDIEATRAGGGLTLLASAASASPYIGLFGTVWGIYHALISIGLSGQGTLDKVSGPVGEALIMTALGLAVAIPAVLALSAFARRNRNWLARMDAFAHDLYALITVGATSGHCAAADMPR